MRLAKLFGSGRSKEYLKDIDSISHKLLLKGGYIRHIATGIYSFLPLGKIVISKIENIIRDEMNKIDGQEFSMPMVSPGELWKQSGRYYNIGKELVRFKNRDGRDMVLNMTHEEVLCEILSNELKSYKQLPFMTYQIQTKYRDEIRPRAGIIRSREFLMKDAYSFHKTEECLNSYYDQVISAYKNIYERVGINNLLVVQSDPGMMGGNISHEFMLPSDNGEDTIFASEDNSYIANKDVAIANRIFDDREELLELEEIYTPNSFTVPSISKLLSISSNKICKSLLYMDEDNNFIFALIRGDFEINEVKLKKFLGVNNLRFAEENEVRSINSESGYISPLNISQNFSNIKIIVDISIIESYNLVIGANKKEYHYKNFNCVRDLQYFEEADLSFVREGDLCSVTNAPLKVYRGIEIGNIFKLGQKYSMSMKCSFLDEDGIRKFPFMGCYGIGVSRLMASVIENSHDDHGPIWPKEIAPYKVHICVLNFKNDSYISKVSNELYTDLNRLNIETIIDDRTDVSPGVILKDADLISALFRIVISDRFIKDNTVEITDRKKNINIVVKYKDILRKIEDLLQ